MEFTFRVDPVKPGEEADAQKTADAMCERVRAVGALPAETTLVSLERRG